MASKVLDLSGADLEALAARLAKLIAPLLQSQAPSITFREAANAFVRAGGSPRFLGNGEASVPPSATYR